jgi:hypothetical protein
MQFESNPRIQIQSQIKNHYPISQTMTFDFKPEKLISWPDSFLEVSCKHTDNSKNILCLGLLGGGGAESDDFYFLQKLHVMT